MEKSMNGQLSLKSYLPTLNSILEENELNSPDHTIQGITLNNNGIMKVEVANYGTIEIDSVDFYAWISQESSLMKVHKDVWFQNISFDLNKNLVKYEFLYN